MVEESSFSFFLAVMFLSYTSANLLSFDSVQLQDELTVVAFDCIKFDRGFYCNFH